MTDPLSFSQLFGQDNESNSGVIDLMLSESDIKFPHNRNMNNIKQERVNDEELSADEQVTTEESDKISISTSEEQEVSSTCFSACKLQTNNGDMLLIDNQEIITEDIPLSMEQDQTPMCDSFKDDEDFDNESSKDSERQLKVKERKPRTLWVRESCRTRETEGEFAVLFKDLQQDEENFKLYFRMSQKKFYELLQILTPYIRKKWTVMRNAIDPNERLAVAMKYLGSGESYASIASSYRMGISTVRNCVFDICDAVCTALQPLAMPLPNEETFLRIEEDFKKLNFPNCLGVMDGRYLTIHQNSSKTNKVHKTSSLALLCLVDSEAKFILVDVGSYDAERQTGIFSNSRLGTEIELHTFRTLSDKALPGANTKVPHVFVGNASLPLRRNLLRPYISPSSDAELAFNDKLAEFRERFADKCFSDLCNKFQIYKEGLQNSLKNVEKLIMATCVLHNFLFDDDVLFGEEENKNLGFTDLKPLGGKEKKNCDSHIRDKFAEYFLSKGETENSSELGEDVCDSVPW